MNGISIYWSRKDFRLHDNPALSAAISDAKEREGALLPCFVVENYMEGDDNRFQFGLPSRLFLSKALPQFAELFSEFLVMKGKGARCIENLVSYCKKNGFEARVFVNEDIHPDFYAQLKKLQEKNVAVSVLNDRLTVDRETKTSTGNLYSVFTPFKRAVWKQFMSAQTLPKASIEKAHYPKKSFVENAPHAVPTHQKNLENLFSSARRITVGNGKRHTINLDDHAEIPDISKWYTNEEAALNHWHAYLKNSLNNYKETRDSLEIDVAETGTSRMSVALAHGLVSSRKLRDDIVRHAGSDCLNLVDVEPSHPMAGYASFLSELIWREFYAYLLYHHPKLLDQEFQEKFRGTISWTDDKTALSRFIAWIRGETGYDIVDAAMKQLARTGWMHNRARMIAASVLTKNLGVDWRWGQEYFRAQLLDLDEASNNGGWQWGASVGADPKPIRIFNPELQAKNYDSSGAYRKKWLGEDRYLLSSIAPIVPHSEAREEALKRYGLGKNSPARDY